MYIITGEAAYQESPAKKSQPAGGREAPLSGFCPMCQMPLELLAGSRVAPEAHFADCADRSVDRDR